LPGALRAGGIVEEDERAAVVDSLLEDGEVAAQGGR
jgi:hypothetical protein